MIKVNLKDIYKFLGLVFLNILSIFVVIVSEEAIVHIISMWIITIISLIIYELNFYHPFCWFPASFSLYSTAYAILYYMGYGNNGYSKGNILLPLVALLIVILMVGPSKPKNKTINVGHFNPKTIKLLMYALYAFIILCVIYFIFNGYSGKSELIKAKDNFFKYGVYSIRFYTMFFLIYLIYLLEIKYTKIYFIIIFYTIPPLLFSMYTGERDSIIRILAIILISLIKFNRISKKQIVIIVPIFILFMIFSVRLKYFFTTGEYNTSIMENNLLYQFLTTDFHAAGSNLQVLINNPWTKGSQSLGLIFTELISPFVASETFFNPDVWFNHVVMRHSAFNGYAFTLVGLGYIIKGYYGVIILFAIVGLLIRQLFVRSMENIYTLSVYIYMLTTIILTFRGSLSGILISLIRVCLLSVLICKILTSILSKKKVIYG